MSKPIKLTPDILAECRADFEKALASAKLADGKISFTRTFTMKSRKAGVHFTTLAWRKMTALLRGFDKEVAWHGVARRGAKEDEYIVEDIVAYPQTVSGASVEMDTEKYAMWLADNAEDERFSHLRMQGHSHVHMGVTPSSVDLNHQEEILHMLGEGDFYIFMIWNKRLESNVKIYDLEKNVLFEDADVSVTYEPDETDGFVEEAKKLVAEKVYAPPYVHQSDIYSLPPYNPGKKDEKLGASGKKPHTKIGAGWGGASYLGQGG